MLCFLHRLVALPLYFHRAGEQKDTTDATGLQCLSQHINGSALFLDVGLSLLVCHSPLSATVRRAAVEY